MDSEHCSLLSHNSTFGLLQLADVPNAGDYGLYTRVVGTTPLRTPGVCHGDELFLLFGGGVGAVAGPADRAVSGLMMGWWGSFARHG
jgi:hypothetical protein